MLSSMAERVQTLQPSSSVPNIVPRKILLQPQETWTRLFFAALFVIMKNGKHLKISSADKKINCSIFIEWNVMPPLIMTLIYMYQNRLKSVTLIEKIKLPCHRYCIDSIFVDVRKHTSLYSASFWNICM